MITRLVLSVLATAALFVPLSSEAAPASLVVAQSADITTLDPAKHALVLAHNVLSHIYDPLLSREADGRRRPVLATEWRTLNETTWQFKLRAGVKFHNGDPFTAEDVKFTIERVLDPTTKSPSRGDFTQIDRVEVVDPLTVRIVTKTPYPVLLDQLSGYGGLIVPRKYLRDKDPGILGTQPVGTGPYKFVAWRKDERVELTVNPDYWGTAPSFTTLIFRPIPEAAARIAELRSGGAQLIDNVPPELVASLKGGSTTVDLVPSNAMHLITFNTLQEGPLQKKDVRLALNYAVDIDTLNKTIMAGLGERIPVALPKSAFGYPKSLQPYPYDPAKAKQLLASAGYPNGFKVPILSRVGRLLKDKEMVEAIAGQLRKVGVEAEPRFVEQGVWAQISERKGREGMFYGSWDGLDPDLVWYPLLFSNQFQSYFYNKDLDELLLEGRSTTDATRRLAAYAKAARLLYDNPPHIPLFELPAIFARDERLSWQPLSGGIIDLRTARFK